MKEKDESEKKKISNLLKSRLKRNYLDCHFKLVFFTIFDKQHFTVRKQTICGNMISV